MSRNHTGPQVDEIVRRIRAKLEAERDNNHDRPGAEQPATLPLLPIDFSHIAVPLRAADERWQQPALDGRQGGIKRRLATILARLLRRIDHGAVAQQEAFNASTIHTMAALRDALGVSVRNAIQVNDQLALLTGTVAADQAHAAAAIESAAARQSEFNERLAAAEAVVQQVAALHADAAALAKRTESIERRIEALSVLRQDVAAAAARLEALTMRVESVEASRAAADTARAAHHERLLATERTIQIIADRAECTARLLHAVEKAVTPVPGIEQRVSEIETREAVIRPLPERLDLMSKRLDDLDVTVSTFGHLRDEIAEVTHRTASQERRLARVLDQARQHLQGPLGNEQLKALSDGLEVLEDSWYVALEDRFRGPREEIRERASTYLPSIAKAAAGTPERPIIDLGSGRGEWLELLKTLGFSGRGVDLNREMVTDCCARGLDATCADLIAYLSRLPDQSAGAVLALHVIEHLPAASWMKLIDHMFRVLQPGGVAIFETPNPENVLVGANAFYLDPTHRQPVPSALLSFLVQQQGFADVTMLPLHAVPPEQHIQESTEVAARFNRYFYGPRDYAVIGWKA